MSAPTQAYPLTWPAGVLRTPAHERVAGSFDSTPDRVRREMLQELDRLVLGKRARTHTVRGSVILSTNVGACRSAPVRWACVSGRIVASVCCTPPFNSLNR